MRKSSEQAGLDDLNTPVLQKVTGSMSLKQNCAGVTCFVGDTTAKDHRIQQREVKRSRSSTSWHSRPEASTTEITPHQSRQEKLIQQPRPPIFTVTLSHSASQTSTPYIHFLKKKNPPHSANERLKQTQKSDRLKVIITCMHGVLFPFPFPFLPTTTRLALPNTKDRQRL